MNFLLLSKILWGIDLKNNFVLHFFLQNYTLHSYYTQDCYTTAIKTKKGSKMKANKSIILSTVAAMVMLATGCGDSSSTSTTTASTTPTTKATTFTVERGPLLGATVTDANQTLAKELGNGQYVFDTEISYPVTSTGGYIDVNRNGIVDAGEVKNTLKLETKEGKVVTLATTMASNEKLKAFLTNDLGIDITAILEKTPGTDKAIEALSDSVFKYVIENNISDTADMNDKELADIKGDYETRYQTYKEDTREAKERESELIGTMSIATLDDADALKARGDIEKEAEDNKVELDKIREELKKEVENLKEKLSQEMESTQAQEQKGAANMDDANMSENAQYSEQNAQTDVNSVDMTTSSTTDADTNTTTTTETTDTANTTDTATTTETTSTTDTESTSTTTATI